MRLIANGLNGQYFRDILPKDDDVVDEVLAAIAYGECISDRSINDDLLSNCLKLGVRLDLWIRYDQTVPVTIDFLKKLLASYNRNVFTKLIPDCLHSKIIWWKGYGAYIGSANHTDRAWNSNIEAGVFFEESDLINTGVDDQIDVFFTNLSELKESYPLTDEIINELSNISKLKKDNHKELKDKRSIPFYNGPSFVQKKKAVERRKEKFREEWNDTLTTLRSIAKQSVSFRPVWVDTNTHPAWQADQFLHAYYYNQVSDGQRKPYEDFHKRNRKNPQLALEQALKWWASLDAPPSNEDFTFTEAAPYIHEKLTKGRVLEVLEDEFSKICEYNHATKDHISKMSLSDLGIFGKRHMRLEERIPVYAKWLYNKTNNKNQTVLELLEHVLDDGEPSLIWERLYEATHNSEIKLPHFGLNSIAELVGWARPDLVPPRNGRTSKALRALGFDVKVYSS